MNKKPNIVRPVGAKPTQEELEAQAKRAFLQKRSSLTEGILFNALHGVAASEYVGNYKPIVDKAVEAADYLMEKLYSVAIKDEDK